MCDAIGLREQGREDAKLGFSQAERPDLLIECRRYFTPHVQQQSAQKDLVERHVGHAGAQGSQIRFQHVELGIADIHLHTNHSL